MSNEIDENLFEQIFDHKFETLANKLINTTNKEENQIIVNNINKNKEKLYDKYKMSPFNDYVIQPSDLCINLIDAINLIWDCNETIQLDLIWKYKNQRIKKWAANDNWWKQKLLSTLCHKKNYFFCACINVFNISWRI